MKWTILLGNRVFSPIEKSNSFLKLMTSLCRILVGFENGEGSNQAPRLLQPLSQLILKQNIVALLLFIIQSQLRRYSHSFDWI